METIELIKADSSDIYKFSSKGVPFLDDTWVGSWTISEKLGGEPTISGNLIKNLDIHNKDSLIGEDFRKTFKIFEPDGNEEITFYDDVIIDSVVTVSGTMNKPGPDGPIPISNKYIYLKIKGVFVPHSREQRVKTDEQGRFSYDFALGDTVKIPANSFFVFQIMPIDSAELDIKTYFLSVQIQQLDELEKPMFRKEILQAKLKITLQGVMR